ncbi:MAG: DUF2752 domain-containing protein [Planctomycetota bacterium]
MWAVAIVIVWLALVWVTYRLAPGVTTCHFKLATGVACPTCGLTRGVTTMLDGDIVGGLAYNPLVLGAGLVFLALLAGRLLCGRLLRLDLSRAERWITLAALAVLFLANWAYVIVCVG